MHRTQHNTAQQNRTIIENKTKQPTTPVCLTYPTSLPSLQSHKQVRSNVTKLKRSFCCAVCVNIQEVGGKKTMHAYMCMQICVHAFMGTACEHKIDGNFEMFVVIADLCLCILRTYLHICKCICVCIDCVLMSNMEQQHSNASIFIVFGYHRKWLLMLWVHSIHVYRINDNSIL